MTRPFADLPASAAWRHQDARVGFEVLFASRDANGIRLEGHSTAVEEGVAWSISYTLVLDTHWRTRSARVVGRSSLGGNEVLLEGDAGSGGSTGDRRPSCPAVSTSTSRPQHQSAPGAAARAPGG